MANISEIIGEKIVLFVLAVAMFSAIIFFGSIFCVGSAIDYIISIPRRILNVIKGKKKWMKKKYK